MRIAVIGAGGCAREVAWTISETPGFELAGYVVTDPARPGATDHLSEPRVSLADARELGVEGFAMGIGAPAVRRKVFELVRQAHPGIPWPTIVHPRATIGPNARLGNGVVICPNATLTVNVTIGNDVLVHYNCTVSHESAIGEGTVLNPLATIAGGVTVGRHVLIGTGAHVLQYRSVGDGATVGAGAVVTRDVAGEQTVIGVPARPAG